MISLRLFGVPEIAINGNPPPPELLWRKHLALCVYLHCSGSRPVGRAHLLDLLWGDKPEGAARHSLNEALRVLRRAFGDAAIEASGDQVRLAVPLDSDLRRVEGALASGAVVEAAALIGGEFLEGFEVAGAAPFSDWVAAMRVEWRRRGADVLAGAAEQLLGRGQAEEAATLASRAVGLDSLSARAVQAAIRSLALTGDRAGALGCVDRHEQACRAVGQAVAPAVAAVAARVHALRARPSTPAQNEVARTRRPPLVGREAPLGELLQTWREANQAGARLALVTGDAGTGRSRLLEEVAERTRLDGATIMILRAVPADAAMPGGGLRALAAGDLSRAPGIAATPPGALAALAATHPRWAEQFPGAASATPVPLREAVTAALRATVTEAPVLLAVDDAQWLDGESLLALLALLREFSPDPLYLLMSWTPEPPRAELEAAAARLGRDLPGCQVRLDPLPLEPLTALVGWGLPTYPAEAAARLARRLAADSAGLPLLAVELLHAVASGLELGDEPAPWPTPARTMDQTRPGPLPDAVVSAIRLGFRRLTPAAQRVLAAAAVLEEREPVERLGRAAGLDATALTDALDELEWQRWMRSEPRGYAFVARVAREVVGRDLVTPGQRRRMQEAAAHA